MITVNALWTFLDRPWKLAFFAHLASDEIAARGAMGIPPEPTEHNPTHSTSQPSTASSAPRTLPSGDSAVKAAKWTGGLGIAGGIAAAIITVVLAWWLTRGNEQATIPLKLSIKSPTDHVSREGEAFTGQIEGLKPGQTIWLFSKQMMDSAGKSFDSHAILINEGPCDVTRNEWSCPKMRVGGADPKNDGMYRVWATVVEPRQARQLLRDVVENNAVFRGNDKEPPYAEDGGLYSEDVKRD